MATTKEYRDFILEQLNQVDNITYKAMMGEYILYKDDIIFGGVYDNRFLVKKTKSLIEYELKDAIPFPGAHPMLLIDSENSDEIRDIVNLVIKDIKEG